MIATRRSRETKRRALAHQCPACRRHWALRVVAHPSGSVVVCRYCGGARGAELLSVAGRSD